MRVQINCRLPIDDHAVLLGEQRLGQAEVGLNVSPPFTEELCEAVMKPLAAAVTV
jgi:hypothetical protein